MRMRIAVMRVMLTILVIAMMAMMVFCHGVLSLFVSHWQLSSNANYLTMAMNGQKNQRVQNWHELSTGHHCALCALDVIIVGEKFLAILRQERKGIVGVKVLLTCNAPVIEGLHIKIATAGCWSYGLFEGVMGHNLMILTSPPPSMSFQAPKKSSNCRRQRQPKSSVAAVMNSMIALPVVYVRRSFG